MKLKVHVVRSRGWSPRINFIALPEFRPEFDRANHRAALLRPAQRFIRVPKRGAKLTAVFGRPNDLLTQNSK